MSKSEKWMSLIDIAKNPEFQKLREIGGHKVYHLEGNAFVHSVRVLAEARKMFPHEPFMWRVALLHDVGKIYTSICHGPDDWEYPDHAMCGSFRGVLCKFIDEKDEDFGRIQWYIRNHIKPLFWTGDDWKMLQEKCPAGCSVRNLARLAVCDIKGSTSAVDQTDKIEYLMTI